MVDDKDEKLFIYEGKEWTTTGRIAKKPIFHKRDVNRQVGTMTIVEISPTGPASGDPSFHKWVDPRELYFVSESDDIDVSQLRIDNDKVSNEEDN